MRTKAFATPTGDGVQRHEVVSRNTFIIDPKGKIAKVFLKVGPAGHSEEVLAALATLQSQS